MEKYISLNALVAEIEKYISNYKGILNKVDKSSDDWVDSTLMLESKIDVLQHILSFLNTLEVKEVEEEPVSNTILLYGLSGSVGIEEAVKETEEYKEWQGDPERQQSFIDFAKFGANYKHHTSKDLEDFAKKESESFAEREYEIDYIDRSALAKGYYWGVKAGAQWQKEHLWKDAQGDDLPEIDKEVIALIEAFGHYKVIFAHRVDENAEIHTSIDGKPLILHPKKHDKGGWNIPNIKWWLDIELPKMEE